MVSKTWFARLIRMPEGPPGASVPAPCRPVPPGRSVIQRSSRRPDPGPAFAAAPRSAGKGPRAGPRGRRRCSAAGAVSCSQSVTPRARRATTIRDSPRWARKDAGLRSAPPGTGAETRAEHAAVLKRRGAGAHDLASRAPRCPGFVSRRPRDPAAAAPTPPVPCPARTGADAHAPGYAGQDQEEAGLIAIHPHRTPAQRSPHHRDVAGRAGSEVEVDAGILTRAHGYVFLAAVQPQNTHGIVVAGAGRHARVQRMHRLGGDAARIQPYGRRPAASSNQSPVSNLRYGASSFVTCSPLGR
jgi:hypothetical protein